MNSLAALIAKRAGFLVKRAARPFAKEGPGSCYNVACAKETDIALLRSGGLTEADFLGRLVWKVGHTNDIPRRRREYRACDVGQRHIWICHWEVNRRLYCERLSQLNQLVNGGKLIIDVCPGCATRHREYFSFRSIGGFAAFTTLMTNVVNFMGEKSPRLWCVINPPDATYTLSPLLKNKIGKHCARRMLSPAVLSYKAGDLPLKQVQAILLKRPSWGYTKAVKADKVKSKMINKTIQKDLTDLRCDIKKTIGDSMWLPSEPKAKRTFEKLAQPQNIISLCETLVSMPSVKDALVPVTFDMLGRVAILRALLVLYPDETTYWEKVDARLLKIRTKADNDRAAISRAIGKMLKADQEAYGPVDVEPILAAAVQPPGDDDDSDDEEEPAT
ncbi:hypothetical protein B0H11DRAFT_2220589 [Mycena galericulata]|nr:hypothetical protein B0H11DRAFT_2220589 [Mycena galericulata]